MKWIGTLVLSFFVAMLVAMPVAAAEAQATRVLYVEGMDMDDAITMVRRQAVIVQALVIYEQDALILSDVAAKVDKAEAILRNENAIRDVFVPHGPIDFEAAHAEPFETRELVVTNARFATSILNTIYQLDRVKIESDGELTAHGGATLLDSGESLLRELKLLD